MYTSQSSSFTEQFPKNRRPEITDLQLFWKNEIYSLFIEFAEYILQQYDLRFGIPVWLSVHGWTYRIGKSGVYLITGIQIRQDGFVVNEIVVHDKKSYLLLLDYVRNLYQEKECEFREKIAEKNRRQAQRNKLRIRREREELLAIQDKIFPEKYNVFHWPDKLNIQKLKQLYMLDARGIQDTVLVDEIGLTLYFRCKYGKEDMERMENGIIRCHNCGNEIAGDGDFRQCNCGYQYSYREYRRSYRRNNMPTGSAAKIFTKFIADWERAKNYQEKMILIDMLLHEFHLSVISGTKGRTVAMNFIDGTHQKVEGIIKELAK